jgi:hypothetical protein
MYFRSEIWVLLLGYAYVTKVVGVRTFSCAASRGELLDAGGHALIDVFT